MAFALLLVLLVRLAIVVPAFAYLFPVLVDAQPAFQLLGAALLLRRRVPLAFLFAQGFKFLLQGSRRPRPADRLPAQAVAPLHRTVRARELSTPGQRSGLGTADDSSTGNPADGDVPDPRRGTTVRSAKILFNYPERAVALPPAHDRTSAGGIRAGRSLAGNDANKESLLVSCTACRIPALSSNVTQQRDYFK